MGTGATRLGDRPPPQGWAAEAAAAAAAAARIRCSKFLVAVFGRKSGVLSALAIRTALFDPHVGVVTLEELHTGSRSFLFSLEGG